MIVTQRFSTTRPVLMSEFLSQNTLFANCQNLQSVLEIVTPKLLYFGPRLIFFNDFK